MFGITNHKLFKMKKYYQFFFVWSLPAVLKQNSQL